MSSEFIFFVAGFLISAHCSRSSSRSPAFPWTWPETAASWLAGRCVLSRPGRRTTWSRSTRTRLTRWTRARSGRRWTWKTGRSGALGWLTRSGKSPEVWVLPKKVTVVSEEKWFKMWKKIVEKSFWTGLCQDDPALMVQQLKILNCNNLDCSALLQGFMCSSPWQRLLQFPFA